MTHGTPTPTPTAQHPELAAVIDRPPLLERVVELLWPDVSINHSPLDVHPPHRPTGADRGHRDNGVVGAEPPLDARATEPRAA
jgi:hypothetical protein